MRRHTKYKSHYFIIRFNRSEMAGSIYYTKQLHDPFSLLFDFSFSSTFISFFLLPSLLSSFPSFSFLLSLHLFLHWVRAFGFPPGQGECRLVDSAFSQLSQETGYTCEIAPISRPIENDQSPHCWRKKLHVWKEEWLKINSAVVLELEVLL